MRVLMFLALGASLVVAGGIGCSPTTNASGGLSQHSGAKPAKSAGSATSPDPGPPPAPVKP